MQSVVTKSSVKSVLDMVRQLASRPSALVDPYALVAALEQLVDVSREINHPKRRRFEAIFKQCRPLVREPKLATVVIQLLGDKEEKQVAGKIHKLLKSSSFLPSVSSPYSQPGQFQRRYAAQSSQPPTTLRAFGGRRRALRGRCFQCRKTGHFIRTCPDLNGRYVFLLSVPECEIKIICC